MKTRETSRGQPHIVPARARVLVVDDERANRALLNAILRGQHDVLEAADAATAIALVQKGGIDLVILDVMMPEVDGYTACAEIKAITRHEYLPVLLLSALQESKDRVLGLKAGADDFLTKPIDRAELELRVRAFLRTRRQEETIRRQLEALRQLDDLKDDLVSLIVHDLRNPLAGIQGILQVMRPELNDTQREDIDLALSAARKLKDTLDDLLQVRQLEEGKLRLQRESVPVDVLMREATETLAGVARDRSIGLVCSGEATASLDKKLMRRVLENLVMNALKYSLRGGAVEVDVERLDLDILVEVKDRGPGIPAEAKQTLFAKFGGGPDGDAHRGFGLGLYLVRLAVSAHGGEVTAVDREGGGTIIRIRLPATAGGPGQEADEPTRLSA